MLKLCTPDLYIKSFNDLPIQLLKNRGILYLVCDIDNTLVAFDEALPNSNVLKFVSLVKSHGITLILISNNVEERVKNFADQLELPYYAFAKKPLKATYRRLLNDYAINSEHVAIIGDQILTDIIGGKRMHFFAILTTPLVEKDLVFTKINRFFENGLFYLLALKKRLRKGEYDV